ncbi:aldehyde ferredoxin oxidoreductase family protein [Desulfosporosinus nitroreducens]|uniref:aldehyde ferredoxin oxidoreductase family protein n=1 Tax=Desulfosporosinus nitroreducens TaxID=2018668 RepID=UPI00207CE982|nr:aldehyde ferredoxin oxidoreductase family protein [Desulfosporosinus nitroreducens]MCO1600899.1 aldehyde ferredoxin oxidoreductase family protein [Desulfosporosinus nitroreducens]
MPFGYMGKILWVDLTTGFIQEEELQDDLIKKYLTGYGLGAKIIFDKQLPGVDPLSPENIFAIMSGLLTGSGAFFSGRWMIMGKSPLTNTWGDANCGGYFAPAIKSTGYDGIFFVGKSEKPVYLLIDGDNKALIDATDLWGKDSNDTIDDLTNRYGAHFKTACIGPAGEKMSKISGVVTDKGRLAARSGLGAVMGSKNLKAVCLGGNKNVNIFDPQTITKLTDDFAQQFYTYKHPIKDKILNEATNVPLLSGVIRYLSEHNMMPISGEVEKYAMKTWGTSGTVAYSANTGDSPVKNWKGVGYIDFPGRLTREISNDSVTNYETDKYGCYNCPLCCGGKVSIKEGPYPISETHKPEYETICGFGTLLLCNDMPSIIKINDLLNRAGIDTISCAATVAWAFEAYENKVITTADTDGLELTWGNDEAVVKLVEKIADGKSIGKHLMNGVKFASEHFGKGSEAYAMHVRGQELPMHDPRNPDGTSLGVGYEAEPTPGRHTSTLDCCSLYRQPQPNNKLTDKNLHPMKNKCTVADQGASLRDASCFMDLINGFGLCAFAFDAEVTPPIVEWANAMTGWNLDFEEYLHIARRIKTMRHSFNIREGINPIEFKMPDRARGIPPLEKGPNAKFQNDFEKGKINYFDAMGYDLKTAKPLLETLDMLDLPEVKKALYK